jgi:putative membrane protein insertion efficiency factor
MQQHGMTGKPNPVVRFLTAIVGLWQLSAPFRTPRCRFAPSCSHYAVEALRTHGAVKGSYLAARRLLRCHPWNPGGVDHVPPRRTPMPSSDVAPNDVSGPRG